MKPGEIHPSAIPIRRDSGVKATRPVLILAGPLGTVPEFLVAFMTSVIPQTFLPTDILIDPTVAEHTGTGLKKVTLLRMHKIGTIHGTDLLRRMGQVSASMWNEVEKKLRLLLNLP